MPTPHANSELSTLIGLFYRRPVDLGQFVKITPDELPQPYRRLLDHPNHMTVTMEEFHATPVDVHVLQSRLDGNLYARRILLERQSDGRVVQFGIMQLNFDLVSSEVRQEIESQSKPLGRILIEHNFLGQIELSALWRITPGPDLCRLMGIGPKQITYGRTAEIRSAALAAVELLEIVTPE